MRKYFSWKDFIPLKSLIAEQTKKDMDDEKINQANLMKLKNASLPKKLLYIPFFVLLYVPQIQSKQGIHIKNSLWITLLIIVSWCVLGIDNLVQTLAIFPISYGIWYIDRIGYKMPFAYEIYELVFEKILGGILWVFKKGEKMHKLEKKEKLIAKAPTKTSELSKKK